MFTATAVLQNDKEFKFPRSLRILKSEDYGVLVRVRNEKTFGLAVGCFSVTGMWTEPREQSLRFGITVGKKNCPRSVDRALFKRILREEARHRAPALLKFLSEHKLGLDISLRLRVPLKTIEGADVGVSALKQTLHSDARKLFDRLERRVRKGLKAQ